jgi:NAD(P)-dependent dehydrogenase (short-subunit alcohol dehydrogenase family)
MAANGPRFANKVIFITGGTSGIGLATAVQFALAGAAHVIVCGRRESKWDEAKKYIQKLLPEEKRAIIQYWPCDVRVEAQVSATIKRLFDEFGRLDVCFNNAGVQPGIITGPEDGMVTGVQFESSMMDDGSIIYRIPAPQPGSKGSNLNEAIESSQSTMASPFAESEIATSCIGIFYCLKWEIHYLLAHQDKNIAASIINTSSRNGVLPDARRHLYAASKAFIISLTKSVANQMAQLSVIDKRAMIRVNAISPGPVDTLLEFAAYHTNNPSNPDQYKAYVQAVTAGVPMQRTAQPEEIAPTVLFLGDEHTSGYITASNICVDGGHTGSPLLR